MAGFCGRFSAQPPRLGISGNIFSSARYRGGIKLDLPAAMNFTTIVGITASISTAVSSLPQLIKLWKEKRAENVSLGMFWVLVIGLAIWVWYGFLKEDWIIIIANGFSFLVNLSTVILSMRYKHKT